MAHQSSGVLRALRPADLDAVVAIDRRITGRSRRVYFERRLKAALADPAGFIVVAVDIDEAGSGAAGNGGTCTGFAIARLQNGEFGDGRRVAVLDVIGVDPAHHGAGIGTLLLEGIAARMKRREVRELRTQVGWRNQELMRFFATAGFELAPRRVLERATAREPAIQDSGAQESGIADPRMDAGMPDYSAPTGNDFETLPHDRVLVHSMTPGDLDAMVAIDAKLTGHDRRPYYEAKLKEVIDETGVRVSLISEADDRPVGYIMARVDYGEFGRAEPTAVIDTIGVEPGHDHRGIGAALLSQLMTNLDALQVETLRTTVTWDNFPLLGFLNRSGFRPAQQLILSLAVT